MPLRVNAGRENAKFSSAVPLYLDCYQVTPMFRMDLPTLIFWLRKFLTAMPLASGCVLAKSTSNQTKNSNHNWQRFSFTLMKPEFCWTDSYKETSTNLFSQKEKSRECWQIIVIVALWSRKYKTQLADHQLQSNRWNSG